MSHISVLPEEVITFLDLKEGDVVVDGTLGNGGHARAIAQHIGKTGTLIGIDQDASALSVAREHLADVPATLHLVEDNARNVASVVRELGITHIDKMLLDLGLRSDQLDDDSRGFSFQGDEPLLMTFKKNPGEADLTARLIVNKWDKENIEAIISGYGEERYARRIAQAIVENREDVPIETTGQLREIIEEAVPGSYRRGRIHPATRTFQALRITVNDELGALKEALASGWEMLDEGGRYVVISFHSLEDRIVKHFFKGRSDCKVLTKKPVQATDEEIANNPRARSAKLRAGEKVQ